MIFFLTSRILISAVAFLYPGYASYKTLSQRPASEEDLERWLMYWSVLGCIVSVEYVAEWAICWIPFYYTLKTILLLYLALPQTQGSTYIYTVHLHPFLREHETQIDSLLAQLRAHVFAFLQKQFRTLWDQFGLGSGQQPSIDPTVQQPPVPPPSGLGGIVGGFWATYGPGIMASGAAMLRPAPQQRAPGSGFGSGFRGYDAAGSAPTAFPTSLDPSAAQSILQRRRQLEAELAALDSGLPSALSPGSVLTPGASPSTTYSRSSSGNDLVHRGPRDRVDSVSGRFEEVEVPSDGEGYDTREGDRPGVQSRGSWFGWGSRPNSGYERLKSS